MEETLSQEASQANLERFLPRIRDIIINLLHGLKRKQHRLRQKNSQDGNVLRTIEARQGSFASSAGAGVDDVEVRQSARILPTPARGIVEPTHQDDSNIPPRTTSIQNGRISPAKTYPPSFDGFANPAVPVTQQRQQPPGGYAYPNGAPSSSSAFTQDIATMHPSTQQHDDLYSADLTESPSYKQPPGVREPKQQDALAALQRGGELERRASRRFSAYQIQKHLGSTSSGIPMIPKTQHSPIPDRGGPSSDNMRAQGPMRHNRDRSTGSRAMADGSPGRPSRLREQVPEGAELSALTIAQPRETSPTTSPLLKTPEDKLRSQNQTTNNVHKRVTSMDFVKSIKSIEPAPEFSLPVYSEETDPSVSDDPFIPGLNSPKRDQIAKGENTNHFAPLQAPIKEPLVLFLQYKAKIKKFVLVDGIEELSIPRLQLAFIEKFAWNTHSNGVDLPEIYLQDSVSGVRYELEDLSDVKTNSVLVLNVDVLDEVKRHVDDGMEGLRRVVEGVKTAVEGQHAVLQRVSDGQQEAVKEVARISAAPPSSQPLQQPLHNKAQPLSTGTASKIAEVQGLRHELAVMRQTYSTHTASMDGLVASLRAKAETVKAAAAQVFIPSFEGDSESGRAYVNGSQKTLNEDSERIINRVDDLQDIVEELRKDVVTRGVRPRPQQLETVSKDISTATAELKKLQELLRREKPIWAKVSENELKTICDDQHMLAMQVDLCADLEDDLEKAAQTFALVEQATKQQNLTNAPGTVSRSTSRTLNAVNADLDPRQAKDGVLGEVRALQPNHETRLEAIERAEKVRQLELESRGEGPFKKELGSFVEAGRLKRSGGVEEAERLRKSKDDRARKENWDRINGVSSVPSTTPTSVPQVKVESPIIAGPFRKAASPETPIVTEAEASSTPAAQMKASTSDTMNSGQGLALLIPAIEPLPNDHMPGAFNEDDEVKQDTRSFLEGKTTETTNSDSDFVVAPEEQEHTTDV